MTPTARHAFLDGLVDDAGLFPPARLSMTDALAARERAANGIAPWMVGRFIVPASRLDELRHVLEERGTSVAASVVVDGTEPLVEALESLARTSRSAAHVVALESLECALSRVSPDDTGRRAEAFAMAFAEAEFAFPPAVYLEVSLAETAVDRAISELLRARAGGFGAFAKIRCGGLDATAVPAPERIAAFLRAARDASLPFKATAGLHHPLPRIDPALGATMHGFLNVIGGAVLSCARGLDRTALDEMLRDPDPANFALDDASFRWRDHTASAAEIANARATFVHSYGSCSLAEPLDDLRDLGLLAAIAT